MNISENKIINAIIYYVKNTKNCKKTKLFKLLYFLDFIHFKRYGLSVTGLDYIALDKGPVPSFLLNIFEENKLPEEYKKHFDIKKKISEEDDKYSFEIVLKKKTPDLDWFTPNEIEILDEVSFFAKDATANHLIEATHLHNSPWHKVINDPNKGRGSYIDYFLAIDDESTLNIDDIKERFETQKLLKK